MYGTTFKFISLGKLLFYDQHYLPRDDPSSLSAQLSVNMGASKPVSIEASAKHAQDHVSLQDDHQDHMKIQHSSSAPAQLGQIGME